MGIERPSFTRPGFQRPAFGVPQFGEDAAGSLLLDTYTGAAAAYSLRKLRTDYAGSAIRVRRSSDNAEQDIGFDGNDLDESALLAFVGAGDGFVVTWYDQSGNGRDVTQATASNQPIVVLSGVFQGGLTTTSLRHIDTTITALIDLPTTHNFSVVQWTKPSAVSSEYKVSWQGDDDIFIYPNDGDQGSGGPRIFWRDLGGNIINHAGADISGGWHMITLVSRASDDHEGYLDDESVGASSSTGGVGPFSTITLTEKDGLQWSVVLFENGITTSEVADIHSRGR